MLATTRSFRTSKIQESVRFDEGLGFVSGIVEESPEIERKLQVAIRGNTKTLTVNDKNEPARRFLGQLHAVVFNADEMETIRGMPEARRRFLDAGIVSLHPPFVQTFTDYNRIIKQKNALLQSAQDDSLSFDKVIEMLVPWNEQLAAAGARIHKARVRFVKRLNEMLVKKLFGDEEISIRYLSSLEGKGDLSAYESLIAERLALRAQAELAVGHSLIGTHRDDLEILLNGHDLRKYGSAGQQRSALLLLQLANISVYYTTRGEYPLFLIDDVDSELDHTRIARLLEYLGGKTQTFVTTSKDSFVEKFGTNAAIFRITNGVAQIQ